MILDKDIKTLTKERQLIIIEIDATRDEETKIRLEEQLQALTDTIKTARLRKLLETKSMKDYVELKSGVRK